MKCKECRAEFSIWDQKSHVSIRVDNPPQPNNPKHIDLCMACYPIHKNKYEVKK